MSVTAPDGSVWPAGSLRAIEHESIRRFVMEAAADGYLKGKVLDWGCGYAPYREIVEEAGGKWYGYDEACFPDNHVGDVGSRDHFGYHRYADAILFTQVIQYVPLDDLLGGEDCVGLLESFRVLLGDHAARPNGHLVLTYPTTWPEVQEEDLHRFTRAGMDWLLTSQGFTIIRHERRASISWAGETFSLGGGVIARA